MKGKILCCWLLLGTGLAVSEEGSSPLEEIKPRPSEHLRVLGGKPIATNQFPHEVSIQTRSQGKWKHVCGGSIISSEKILTSAVCNFDDMLNWRVIAGAVNVSAQEASQQIRGVKSFIVHPNFTRSLPLDYDYGLLYLDQPLELTPGVQPIELAEKEPNPGDKCLVAGWSRFPDPEPPSTIQQATVVIEEQSECVKKYMTYRRFVTERMICAGMDGVGLCRGDGGSSLVCNKALTGIVSWGKPCSSDGFPQVFSKVPAALEWINTN